MTSNFLVEKKVRYIPLKDQEKIEGRNKDVEKMPIWEEIKRNVGRSKIPRYKWRLIFGESLTAKILKLKKKGFSAIETYHLILDDEVVRKIIKFFPERERHIKEKIKISVCARYGENNTALKILNEGDQDGKEML